MHRPTEQPCQSPSDLRGVGEMSPTTVKDDEVREAARLLLLELSDWTLDKAKSAVGCTNVAVIRLRRDELARLVCG